ncbi:hypothetical protein BDZ89DRAFT_1164540 [Hymenopellis radicata]|nr:hypothetical protein BDZ89DRAFT_1164540 [Hymenopellis radicata]
MQADENEILFQKILRRIVQTGEWERLKATLVAALEESGWSGEMQQSSRAYAQSQAEDVPIHVLSEEMSGKAHKLLPPDIRARINTILRECIQRHYDVLH